jgi:hypothetical protein
MYCYQLYAESKLNLHKAFSVVLADDIYSASRAAGKGSGKQRGICGGRPSNLKRKKEAITDDQEVLGGQRNGRTSAQRKCSSNATLVLPTMLVFAL